MFNSLLLTDTFLLEGNTGDKKVSATEDIKRDKIIILKGNSINNDLVIEEQPIQFKPMQNNVKNIKFG